MRSSLMDRNESDVFWVDCISLSLLLKIFRFGILRQNSEIRFMRRLFFGSIVFRCFSILGIIKAKAVKIEYSMGNMCLENGKSLQQEAWRITSETAVSIVNVFSKLSVYNKLSSLLPQGKLDLYFEKCIYKQIFPLMQLLSVVRWYNRNGMESCRHVIIWPENGFSPELQHVWPDKMVSLVANKPFFCFSWVRPCIKKLYNCSQDLFASILPKGLKLSSGDDYCIATHYAESIDLERRSDIFWYPESRIDPAKVIIYFDRSYNHPITNEHIKQIESMGMQWVSLRWSWDIPWSLKSVWRAPLKKGSLLKAFKEIVIRNDRDLEGIEKWLLKACAGLLKDIEYWQAFYRKFNIKVHHDAVESGLQNIAQNIALDFVGGIRVGKQRSEFDSPVTNMLGNYPDHIFFSWNSQAPLYLKGDRNRNDYCIISGFPYDAVFAGYRNKVSSANECFGNNGVQFVVAFFDNMFAPHARFSKKMMLSSYKVLLEWVLEDREVGLIIKSKKPLVLDSLPEIHNLLKRAKETGRCIQLDNVYGRLVSGATYGADIAVGIGISSAVTEAVIAGCRGVHCDLNGNYSHLYYRWGYGKVVFDDINQLMMAMRKFKEEPESEPHFGDFSPIIDQLDPFQDGRAGERVGTYIRWFLEAIEAGKDRNIAIQLTNERYADAWGEDKIIPMCSATTLPVIQEDEVKLYG